MLEQGTHRKILGETHKRLHINHMNCMSELVMGPTSQADSKSREIHLEIVAHSGVSQLEIEVAVVMSGE